MNTPEYITLTELGKLYGVGARDVGGWLKGLRLREENGWPSREAIKEGIVRERRSEWGSAWHWHREKTCAVLDGMCYPRAGTVPLFPHVEEHEDFTIIRGGRK